MPNNIILTSYLTASPDGQRGTKWPQNLDAVKPLAGSCRAKGVDLKVFTDFVPPNVQDWKIYITTGEEMKGKFSPNVFRWNLYHEWLEDNRVDFIWMVDSTDVVLLNEPFGMMGRGKLYSGCEHGMVVNNSWMRTRQEPHLKYLQPDYREVIIGTYPERMLPNCGLVGGDYDTVMEYLSCRIQYHEAGILQSTDMAVHNYIVWKHFADRLVYGGNINTRFKRNEFDKTKVWKHK